MRLVLCSNDIPGITIITADCGPGDSRVQVLLVVSPRNKHGEYWLAGVVSVVAPLSSAPHHHHGPSLHANIQEEQEARHQEAGRQRHGDCRRWREWEVWGQDTHSSVEGGELLAVSEVQFRNN